MEKLTILLRHFNLCKFDALGAHGYSATLYGDGSIELRNEKMALVERFNNAEGAASWLYNNIEMAKYSEGGHC